MYAYRCVNRHCDLYDMVWFSDFSARDKRLATGRAPKCTHCGGVVASVARDEIANLLLDEYDDMQVRVGQPA